MKKLTEFIEEYSCRKLQSSEIFDELDKQFFKHIQIDRLINEEIIYNKYHLFESFGTFEGSKELVKLLIETFFKFDKSKKCRFDKHDLPCLLTIETNKIRTIDCKFTKKFLIVCTDELNSNNVANSASYITNVDNEIRNIINIPEDFDMWDDNSKSFNYSVIIVYDINRVSENKLFQSLLHELEHVWDDYILHSEADSSLYEKSKIYKCSISVKLQEFLNSSEDFLSGFNIDIDNNINFDSMSKQQIRDKVMSIVYKLDKFEAKAFIAQLSAFLEGTRFNNMHDCFSYIRKNYDSYNHYKLIYQLLNEKENSILDYIGVKKSDINKLRKISKDVWHKMLNHAYLACENSIKPKMINEHYSILTYPINPNEKIWNRISN